MLHILLFCCAVLITQSPVEAIMGNGSACLNAVLNMQTNPLTSIISTQYDNFIKNCTLVAIANNKDFMSCEDPQLLNSMRVACESNNGDMCAVTRAIKIGNMIFTTQFEKCFPTICSSADIGPTLDFFESDLCTAHGGCSYKYRCGLAPGAIAGIVIAVFVFFVGLLVAGFFIRNRRRYTPIQDDQ